MHAHPLAHQRHQALNLAMHAHWHGEVALTCMPRAEDTIDATAGIGQLSKCTKEKVVLELTLHTLLVRLKLFKTLHLFFIVCTLALYPCGGDKLRGPKVITADKFTF